MSRTIGIDLGTTNSVVAFLDGNKVETIPNPEGSKLTPSVVYYKSDDEIIVGELAKRQLVIEPARVVRSIKRLMGKRQEELGEDVEDLPYEVSALEDGMACVLVDGEVLFRPEEVSADILERLRATAEDFLGESVTDAVITVPAHFNDQQRTATKAAAEMAGLNVLRIINEPTAAALAYGAGRGHDGIVVVFDFGGGTFDVSILQITGDIYEVISTNGDNNLGGDDIDHALYQEFCDQILQTTGIDPTEDRRAVQRIREAAEKAKCELSMLETATISLPFIVADSSGPKHFQTELTRDDFNEMMDPIFQRLFEPCARALTDAAINVGEISEVLLVGGSTRIPRVQQMVGEYFGRPPNCNINPDEAVAAGAAIQGAVITGDLREVLLLDVTPLTLGIELAGGVFKELIPRNSTIPCEASRKFTTVVDNQTTVLVHVMQGERRVASENHSLAQLRLVGIPAAPKELPEIEVRFSIDANGILSVNAMDLSTGLETGIVVENYGSIGSREEEVKRMVDSAKEHVEEDERFLRFSERRTRAERLHNHANRLIEALGSLITEDHLREMKEAMLRLDLATDREDERAMTEEQDKLSEIIALYEQNQELARVLARNLSQTGHEDELGPIADFDEDEFVSAIEAHLHPSARTPEVEVEEEEEAPAPKKEKGAAKPAPKKPAPFAAKPKPAAASQQSSPAPPEEQGGEPPCSAPRFEVPSFDEEDDEESSFDPRNIPPPPPV